MTLTQELIDRATDVAQVQQLLLRELRNGHSIVVGRDVGSTAFCHDGHVWVVTGHGARTPDGYRFIRDEATFLGCMRSCIAEPVRDTLVWTWSGEGKTELDLWRSMFRRLMTGRPAMPRHAAWRRATPLQRGLAALALAVGSLGAIIGAGYLYDRHVGPVPSPGAVMQRLGLAGPGAQGRLSAPVVRAILHRKG